MDHDQDSGSASGLSRRAIMLWPSISTSPYPVVSMCSAVIPDASVLPEGQTGASSFGIEHSALCTAGRNIACPCLLYLLELGTSFVNERSTEVRPTILLPASAVAVPFVGTDGLRQRGHREHW